MFFHPDSRTMICADVVFNLARHRSRRTRLVAFLMANREPGTTWLEHVMIRDREAAREQIGRMLAWDFDRIVLSHGPIVEAHGHEVLRRAYAWL